MEKEFDKEEVDFEEDECNINDDEVLESDIYGTTSNEWKKTDLEGDNENNSEGGKGQWCKQ